MNFLYIVYFVFPFLNVLLFKMFSKKNTYKNYISMLLLTALIILSYYFSPKKYVSLLYVDIFYYAVFISFFAYFAFKYKSFYLYIFLSLLLHIIIFNQINSAFLIIISFVFSIILLDIFDKISINSDFSNHNYIYLFLCFTVLSLTKIAPDFFMFINFGIMFFLLSIKYLLKTKTYMVQKIYIPIFIIIIFEFIVSIHYSGLSSVLLGLYLIIEYIYLKYKPTNQMLFLQRIKKIGKVKYLKNVSAIYIFELLLIPLFFVLKAEYQKLIVFIICLLGVWKLIYSSGVINKYNFLGFKKRKK